MIRSTLLLRFSSLNTLIKNNINEKKNIVGTIFLITGFFMNKGIRKPLIEARINNEALHVLKKHVGFFINSKINSGIERRYITK